jgi:hypothetical protein
LTIADLSQGGRTLGDYTDQTHQEQIGNRQSEIGNVVVLFPCGNALPDTEAVKDVQLCSVP